MPVEPQRPAGWGSDELVPLVAPGSAAWIAPAFGGNVVAFAVEADGEWQQVLFSEGRDALVARPTRYGCPVLFPFPGLVQDATYRWNGIVRALPINAPDRLGHVHGFAHTRPWRVVDSAVDRVTLEFSTASDLDRLRRAAYPFDVTVHEHITLVGSTLSISLTAANHGATSAPVGLGLHPYVSLAFLDEARDSLAVTLPGTLERVLSGSIPTGELEPVTSSVVRMPVGGTVIRSRTGFGCERCAAIRGSHGQSVEMSLAGDWTDLTLFAPADQESVSLEPTTCEISAGTLLADGHESLMSLAPGSQRTASITLRASRQSEARDRHGNTR
jgi:aldose 1-epimerase